MTYIQEQQYTFQNKKRKKFEIQLKNKEKYKEIPSFPSNLVST